MLLSVQNAGLGSVGHAHTGCMEAIAPLFLDKPHPVANGEIGEIRIDEAVAAGIDLIPRSGNIVC